MDAARAHKEVYEKALSLVVSTPQGRVQPREGDRRQADRRQAEGRVRQRTAVRPRGLLARKLVEAGTACVQITLGGWDMHNNIFPPLCRPSGCRSLDKAMGTLVKDLDQRGKLKDTVIVWMGDFGRTPRINQNAGRDHYPRAGAWCSAAATSRAGSPTARPTRTAPGVAKDEVERARPVRARCTAASASTRPRRPTPASATTSAARTTSPATSRTRRAVVLDQGSGELDASDTPS